MAAATFAILAHALERDARNQPRPSLFCGRASVIGETMKPGATAFTVMLREATSTAIARRQPDQAGLRGDVIGLAGVTSFGDDGGHVNDAAIALAQHEAERLLNREGARR